MTVLPRRIFSVTGAVILLCVCAVLTLVLLADAAIRASVGNAMLLAPWLLLGLWVVYIVGVASDIRADTTGMRVQNLLRRTWMPWSDVTRIAMRWQLEITRDGGGVLRCFGGPTRSRSRRIGPERTRENSATETHDGIATLHRLRASADVRSDAEVNRSWDLPALAALAVLVVWAAVAVIITL